MDFSLSPKAEEYRRRVAAFMDEHVYPNEELAERQVIASGNEHHEPEIVTELRKKTKADGLWNLFMPDEKYGKGLKNAEYAPVCEMMGRSRIGPYIFNCSAPDTGNMEILAEFGTAEQKRQWLEPCLEGKIRSCFSMTEPETAGSDPTQLRTRAVRAGDYYTINGHKWFTSGALHSLRDRDGGNRPRRRAASARQPDNRPGRHCGVQYRAAGAGDGTYRKRRPLRDHLQGLPRAGDQRAGQGG